MSDDLKRGTIKWFDEKKGFGFITPEDGGEDIFFHYSAIKVKGFKTIANEQLVEYELATENGKKKATTVKIRLA